MTKTNNRLHALALAFAMILSFVLPGLAQIGPANSRLAKDTALSVEELTDGTVRLPKVGTQNSHARTASEEPARSPEELVRVSIILDQPATLDRGFAVKSVSENTRAIKYRDGLKEVQRELTSRIETAIGRKIDVKWNLTLAMNAISAEIRYGDIETIESLKGVQSVVIENVFEPISSNEADASPLTAITSGDMVYATQAWAEGYTGAGSRVAVIDTGTAYQHTSFNNDAFEYSLQQNANAKGMTLAAYKSSLNLLTWSEINSLKSQLNKSSITSSVYLNTKHPFAYNYVDNNYDVTHANDKQGEHGSHVAGITTANRYVKSGNSYVDAASTVYAVGMAPDAQLITMKVFGTKGGAYESDYMAAIEDAIVLKCDSINLSLGSNTAGFTLNSIYASVMNNMVNSGSVVAIAAGNAYSWPYLLENNEALYADDANLHTGGSPGTYTNSLCVASADNIGTVANPISFNNGNNYSFINGINGSNANLETIAGTHNYVYIDGVGSTAELSAVNGRVSLNGKIVIVNRGEIAFSEKATNALSYGAKALIVANNADGSIRMDVSSFTGTMPVASILKAAADEIRSNSASSGSVNGYSYYTGSVKISGIPTAIIDTPRNDASISIFSSRGVPGSLLMKPEITAPGGNIYSVNGMNNTDYENMSGTSMATPHISGLAGVLAQHIRENNVLSKVSDGNQRHFINSILMSTATPMKNGGKYLSILEQGSGLANVYAAIKANSYIYMNSDATSAYRDGKVKVEFGQDAQRTGSYSYSFIIKNIGTQSLKYDLHTDMFTQEVYEKNGVTYMSEGTRALGANVTYTVNGSNVTSVTVGANSSVTVKVNISLTANEKAKLNNENDGGAYIEGFTYVTCTSTSSDGAVLDSEHSIPLLGYYGSWTDASMFDNTSAVDVAYGTEKVPYTGVSNTNYLVVRYSDGINTTYLGNPYVVENSFPADRLAMGSGTTIVSATYSLIRNAASIIPAAIKSDGTLLYSGSASNQVYQPYYHPTQGKWMNVDARVATFGRTVSSFGAREGDRVAIGVFAIPEYYTIKLNPNATSPNISAAQIAQLFGQGELGDGAYVGYTVTIDNTSPSISNASLSADGRTLNVTASDNNYIAYIGIMNTSGTTKYAGIVPNQSAAGQTVNGSISLSGLNLSGTVAVVVGDYAGNEAAYAINLSGGDPVQPDPGSDGDIYMLTDTIEIGKEYIVASSNRSGSTMLLSDTNNGANAYLNGGESVTVLYDGSKTYIPAASVSAASVWITNVGSGYSNNGWTTFINKATGIAVTTLSSTDGSRLYGWNNANYASGILYANYQLKVKESNSENYVVWNGENFVQTATPSNTYLYVKTVASAAPTATPKPTATPTVAPTATPRPTATPTVAPTATPRPTVAPTALPTSAPGGRYTLVNNPIAGEQYIIVVNDCAVSNTVYSSNRYLNAKAVTINSDNTLTLSASVSETDVLWTAAGDAVNGLTFRNVGNGKYMGLDSSEYLAPVTTALAWKYENGDLNNQIDSAGYYYLALASSKAYFTTSKNANGAVKFYKLTGSDAVPTEAPTAVPTPVPTATPTPAPTSTPVPEGASYVEISAPEVGDKVIVLINGYAVGNTIHSNNHYLSAKAVTVNSNGTLTIPSSVSANDILWTVGGSASAGWTFRNVSNSKYIGLDSSEYLAPTTTSLAWKFENGDLNNQIDSAGYYYLALSTSKAYFTTSKSSNGSVKLYKLVGSNTTSNDEAPIASFVYLPALSK